MSRLSVDGLRGHVVEKALALRAEVVAAYEWGEGSHHGEVAVQELRHCDLRRRILELLRFYGSGDAIPVFGGGMCSLLPVSAPFFLSAAVVLELVELLYRNVGGRGGNTHGRPRFVRSLRCRALRAALSGSTMPPTAFPQSRRTPGTIDTVRSHRWCNDTPDGCELLQRSRCVWMFSQRVAFAAYWRMASCVEEHLAVCCTPTNLPSSRRSVIRIELAHRHTLATANTRRPLSYSSPSSGRNR